MRQHEVLVLFKQVKGEKGKTSVCPFPAVELNNQCDYD